MKNIILNISTVFFFRFKIRTGIIDHLTTVKHKFQVFKLQSVQINLLYMKDSAGSCENRGRKHFPHRNIHICHTVFKICLFFDIFKFMQMNDQICFIVIFALDFYPLTGIQSLYDRLLDPFVQFIIQCIDLYNLRKNLREIRSNLWYRISNDRKASLIAFDIAVHNLSGFIVKFYLQFLLHFRQSPCFRCRYR